MFLYANVLTYYLEDNLSDSNSSRQLYINDAIEIIFSILITFFLLKYRYYIHHFISLFIFIILCVLLDLLQDNYNNYTYADIPIVLNSIMYVLSDSFLYSYLKYLILFKYNFYMDVICFLSIFNFAVIFLSLIVVIIIQSANGNNEIIIQFYSFYIEYDIGYIVLRFLLGFFLLGVCM